LRILHARLAAPCILAAFLYTPVLAHTQQKPGVAPGGYPIKPIRVVVTIAAGGGPDVIVRIVGQVQTMFASTVSAIPHLASGRLRGIAVSSPKRLPFLPELPTVAESGVPDFRASNSYNLIAPAGTPRAILHALNSVISTGLNAPAMVKRLAAEGTEPLPPATPVEFKAMTAREYARVEKQVKGLNIKDF
jgi:tripartite-type tricarboxylate transporter receptor subunit TctC